jgi:hypothetical protein
MNLEDFPALRSVNWHVTTASPPGHDAWTVGDEPCVIVGWQGFADYAKR